MRVWSETTLNGLIHIKHGYAFLGEYFSDSGEYVVLTPGNFFEKGGFRFREGKEKFYLGEIPESFILKKHDLIVAMTEQGEGLLGSTAFIPENSKYLHNQRLGLIDILDTERLDKTFLYYLMNNQYIRSQIRNTSTGTKVRHTSPKSIYNVKVFLPPILEQKKIAAILSAYDELIENNKKSIQVLENMAEESYKEWFVRFRFPNWENTEFEKSVPKDWKIVELKDIALECSKSTKAGEHLENRYYLPLDVMSTKAFLPDDHYDYQEAQSSLVTFEKGEIIFGAMRPYQHKVNMAPFNGITRTTCFVIKPKNDYVFSFLYLLLFQKTTIDYAMLISNGADRPYAVWNRAFERLNLLLPTEDLLLSFNNHIKPMLDKILSFYFINRNLEETKNELLPRLISGKLSVEDLDIQFPPSMQE